MAIPLTPPQREQLLRKRREVKRGRTLRTKGIEPPASVEASYYRALRGIVRELQNQVMTQLLPILEYSEPQYIADSRDDILRRINRILKGIASTPVIAERTQALIAARMATSTEAFNRAQFIREINEAVGVSLQGVITQEGVAGEIEESVKDNIGLIKTIPEEYHSRLRSVVDEGIRSGNDAHSIRKSILELGHSTEARAKFIARDQVAKLNAAVTQTRQTRVGVTHYFWRTSRDQRVRPSHEEKEGNRYAWSDPPADTGHPGQDYQCRCSAEPDLSGLLETARTPARAARAARTPRVSRAARAAASRVTARQFRKVTTTRRLQRPVSGGRPVERIQGLKGTEKQVKWAEEIKAGRIADLEKLEALPIPAGHPAEKALAVIRKKYESAGARSAAWWIEHDQTAIKVQQLANEIAKGKKVLWPEAVKGGFEAR